jgi:RNA polymerase sigma-70 factor (ECF subfamily)
MLRIAKGAEFDPRSVAIAQGKPVYYATSKSVWTIRTTRIKGRYLVSRTLVVDRVQRTIQTPATSGQRVSATPVSLLNRLRVAKPDAVEWRRLQEIYLPLIRTWLARVPGLHDEAADLSQEVLLVVIRELPHFERQREGSFRAWLRQVTVNRVRVFTKQRQRRPQVAQGDGVEAFLDAWQDPSSAMSQEWDRQHDQHVFRKLLGLVEADFSPTTWEAFRRFALDGQPAAAVAVELGISENAVLLSKSRVLKRLRTEAAGLIDGA